MSSPDTATPVPAAIQAVLATLDAVRAGRIDATPRVRLRTRSGGWATLDAADLEGLGEPSNVAVVVERAQPAELAPLILLAYGLTQREAQVAQLALRGKPNKTVAADLRVTVNTVEDHLKSVFTKVGLASRGELMARFLFQQYGP